MKRILILLAAFSMVACGAEAPIDSDFVVIDGATLWNGPELAPVPNATMLIQGEQILSVGPRDQVELPESYTLIEADEQFLMPGIINAHGHVGMTRGLVESRQNYTRENILDHLSQYARYGVTTVMSLGLDSGPMFDVRGPASRDETPRATVLTAGRGFTGLEGYPAHLVHLTGIPYEVDTPEDVETYVQELVEQNVDMVKIWVDDHFGRYEKIRPELYTAIIQEAHARGLRVMAHVFYLEDAKGLVEAGVDGLAHNVRDQEIDDELIRMLLTNDVFVAATLTREESTSMYASPPEFLDDPFFSDLADPAVIEAIKDPSYGADVAANPDYQRHQDQFEMAKVNIKKLFDAGVRVAFGTDSGPPGRFQGYFEHRELELMVELGIPPVDALRIATLHTAEALGIEDYLGSLEAEKRADFILLNANPLEDIRNTRQIDQVWIGGRLVE